MNWKSFVIAIALAVSVHAAGSEPAVLDLLGKWEGALAMPEAKLTLILRITTNAAGRVEATMELPDQGQKDLRVDAVLFNAPQVRLEIDQFDTAYNGKVNDRLDQIEGEFEQGPRGHSEPLVFKRSTHPDTPEPELAYAFGKDEPQDIRGFWRGEIEGFGPGVKLIAGLRIGRAPDGTFRAALDLPEQGSKGIPANSVTTEKDKATIKWKGFQSTFEATLSQNGNELSGAWLQGGRSNSLAFQRLAEPLQLLPKNLSFSPDANTPQDVRGYWKGALEIPGRKLRLVLKIGRTPDGSYAGTLSSIDQGAKELPASAASFTAPALKMEWRAIRGKYEAKMSADGKSIEGTWEQFGNPMPLTLERITEAEANRN